MICIKIANHSQILEFTRRIFGTIITLSVEMTFEPSLLIYTLALARKGITIPGYHFVCEKFVGVGHFLRAADMSSLIGSLPDPIGGLDDVIYYFPTVVYRSEKVWRLGCWLYWQELFYRRLRIERG